jgi:hypothetical protein
MDERKLIKEIYKADLGGMLEGEDLGEHFLKHRMRQGPLGLNFLCIVVSNVKSVVYLFLFL